LVAGHSLGEYIALYVAGFLTGQLVYAWSSVSRTDGQRRWWHDGCSVGFDREQLEQQILMWCWLMTTVLLRL